MFTASSPILISRMRVTLRLKLSRGVPQLIQHKPLGAAFVARELAPARLRSSRKQVDAVFEKKRAGLLWDCTAAQREQAPSPHRFRPWLWRAARHWRSIRQTAGEVGDTAAGQAGVRFRQQRNNALAFFTCECLPSKSTASPCSTRRQIFRIRR
ncbi:hypothetical protein EMIT0P100_280017 [Pseudomonas sp. IT-P100]